MAEHQEYTGGGYASSGWPDGGPPPAPSPESPAGAAPGLGGEPAAGFREQIKDLTQQAREETVRLAVDAREQVQAVLRRRQTTAADRLAGVAAALRDAGRRLEREAARPAPGVAAVSLVAVVDDGPVGAEAGGYPHVVLTAAPPPPRAVDAATRGLCELAERAARQVDRAAVYLRRSEMRDVVRDVEDLARRRPAAFVGGTFAAGLLLARFFKSSAERRPVAKLAGRLG